MYKLILASKSKVRKEILHKNGIFCEVFHSNLDEEPIKASLLNEGATPVIISKPENREIALNILKKLNGKEHKLISSVCISKGGTMMWNHTDIAILKMKRLSEDMLKEYLLKISDEKLFAYNVYQIEGPGKDLFSEIKGDESTIMGLPIKKVKEYLRIL